MNQRPQPPKPARPGLVTVAAMACLALVLAACSDSGSGSKSASGDKPASLAKIKVVLDWTPNTNHSGMYLAKARGWYRAAGLDVSFLEPGDSSNLQLLAAGKADVAVSTSEDVVPARAQGLPVQSVAAIIEHNTSSLVSLASAGLTRPRDLQGHTYGGYGGQLEKALVSKLVACDGGDPSKVSFADVGEADYRIGLQRHQYDVVWIFDGWDGVRLSDIDHLQLNRMPFIDHTDCIPDWYTPVLATSTAMESKRAADLKSFLAITARGYRAAMTDPSAAADALLAASPDLDKALVERSAKYLSTRYAQNPAQWGQQSADTWTRFIAFLGEAGIVDKPVSAPDVFTNRFLPSR